MKANCRNQAPSRKSSVYGVEVIINARDSEGEIVMSRSRKRNIKIMNMKASCRNQA